MFPIFVELTESTMKVAGKDRRILLFRHDSLPHRMLYVQVISQTFHRVLIFN